MKSMYRFWLRFFAAQNYAFCKSNAYLAAHREEPLIVAHWEGEADKWYLDWWKLGKDLK